MCRLFGLHCGRQPTTATFWLLDAPDSLRAQGRRNPDGTGIGVFAADGSATLDKQPIDAWDDTDFARDAQTLRGTTFVAHVRYASTGAHTVANTHPFELDGRLFAHNGVVGGLDALDARLDELDAGGLVGGQTDSERVFALITAVARRNGGDIEAALRTAIAWIADNVPVLALNLVLTTATDLWALRYPEVHALWFLEHTERQVGDGWDRSSDRIRAQVEPDGVTGERTVVVASEQMDAEAGWTALEPGELLHVDSDLVTTRTSPFGPLRHPLRLSQLEPVAAASQRA
ncbi:class II glutamine amidotransferase [Mumia sp. zg.B21]|uniref:class II glutamine amidotransferase n=1 Tax=unclassified Mumia TaxID=2621872 RepID=UPI001C6F01D1|nr:MULTISPECIES: class II glutamine amidotransferase [unclassified Mumia]MBW9211065.1 class II glutamine amidotransferase [Mumia sp. zg.B21]MDD9347879.1 class II glutamine amidotransferase [Mumia sp.]